MQVEFNIDEILNIETARYSPEMTIRLEMDEDLSRAAIKAILEGLRDQCNSDRTRSLISDLAREYLSEDDLADLQIPA